MFGKILRGMLLVLLGIVLGIGCVAGVGIVAYKTLTVGQIADLVRLEEDVVGEDLRDKTIEEAILFAGDLGSKNVGELEQLFPVIETKLDELLEYQIGENGSLSDLVTVDRERLKQSSLSTLGADFNDIFQITASLSSLSKILEFELPNMPLFDPNNVNGIAQLPLNEAITELSERLDFDTMTLGDLQDEFGVKLFAAAGESLTLVDKILERTWAINGISGKLSDKIDSLKLSDLDIVIENDLFNEIVGTGDDELTIGQLQTDVTERIDQLTLSELFDVTGTPLASMGDMTFGELKESGALTDAVNNICLVDILGEQEEGTILYAICYRDGVKVTVGELSARIDELTIDELIQIEDDGVLAVFKGLKISDLGDETTVRGAIDGLKLNKIITTAEDDRLMNALLYDADGKPVTVGGISERVNEVKLEDLLGSDAADNHILAALYRKNTTLKNIRTVISELTITEVFPDVKVFTEKNGMFENYDTYTLNAETGAYTNTKTSGTTNYCLADGASVWLFILYDYNASTHTFTPASDITLMNINARVNGATDAFKAVPIEALWEAGLIGGGQPNEGIRHKTLEELISLIGTLPFSV